MEIFAVLSTVLTWLLILYFYLYKHKEVNTKEHLSVETVLARIEEAKSEDDNYFLLSKKEYKNNPKIQSYLEEKEYFLWPKYDIRIIYYEVYFEGITHRMKMQMELETKYEVWRSVIAVLAFMVTIVVVSWLCYSVWSL